MPRSGILALLVVIVGAPPAYGRRVTLESLEGPGSYAVGVTTVTLVDASRPTAASGAFPGSPVRTLETEVYYPAAWTASALARDVPVATPPAPFPLVVFAHGLGGGRTNIASTIAHVASRGYVVAAPEFPLTNLSTFLAGTTSLADLVNQPGDVSFVIDAFTGDAPPVPIDRTRVGLLGYSFGGATTFLALYGGPLADARIRAAVVLAPLTCPFDPAMFSGRAVPFLLVHGTSDRIVDEKWSRRVFPLLRGPKFFVEIVGGDHLGFDNAFGGARDLDLLPFYYDTLRGGLPGGEAGQEAALIAAFDAVPGTDAARCFDGPFLADPDVPRDPLLDGAEQTRIANVALAAFVEGFVGGDGAAKRFVRKFPRRVEASALRFCARAKGRGTCRAVRFPSRRSGPARTP